MDSFVKRSRIDAPAAAVFRWHMQADAFERLMPPWERVEVIDRTGGIDRIGSRVTLLVGRWPLRMTWVAEHTHFEADRMFRDVQLRGPFARWEHTHLVQPDGPAACWLEDRVDYALRFGRLGRWLWGSIVERKLQRIFDYRHRITTHHLTR
ncbi:MAG TPA: SRPBCC family protein [Candidatus Polarisedimenticolaceae bacterium]|nr:SRPBCC family protein [Candidatus Polarisedimenticolaceae bacterium]